MSEQSFFARVSPTAWVMTAVLLLSGVFTFLNLREHSGRSAFVRRDVARDVEVCRFSDKQQECLRAAALDCISRMDISEMTFDECYKVTGVKRPELKGGGE